MRAAAASFTAVIKKKKKSARGSAVLAFTNVGRVARSKLISLSRIAAAREHLALFTQTYLKKQTATRVMVLCQRSDLVFGLVSFTFGTLVLFYFYFYFF